MREEQSRRKQNVEMSGRPRSGAGRKIPRRQGLRVLLGAFTGTLFSSLTFTVSCRRQPRPASVVAAAVGDLEPGQTRNFMFGDTRALLIHTGRTYRAVAADCTHGACSVQYSSDCGMLLCPCHDGQFDLSGRPVAGPLTVPLEVFEVEIQATDIVVTESAGQSPGTG